MKKVLLSMNASMDKLRAVKKAGFDCIEPSNTDLMEMSRESFDKAAEELKKSALKCTVIDNPIPCAVSFSDTEWNPDDWNEYLQESGKRAKKLRASYWCFGNGSSRMLPEDGRLSELTKKNFTETVLRCADTAAEYGLSVIVEPLGPSVTNYLQTVEETAEYVASLGRENIFTMVDYRWEYEQNRSVEDLYRYADRIVHAHLDNPGTDYLNKKERKIQSLNDGIDYTEFLDFVKSDCFNGIVSIEANCFEDYEREICDVMDFYAHYGIISYRNGEK